MHVNEGDQKFIKWIKTWKKLENPKGKGLEWVREVWEMKSQRYQEKDRQKWVADRTRRIYRSLVNFERWGVEVVSRHLSRRCREKAMSIDHVSRSYRGIKTPEARYDARSIHQVSRSCREVRNFLDRSTRCRGVVEIVIRKTLGSSTIASYRGGVEPAFQKQFFEMRKT